MTAESIQRIRWYQAGLGTVAGGRTEIVFLLVTLLAVAAVAAHIILNIFYVQGAFGDPVWYSTLSWHNRWDLRVWSIRGGTDSSFNAHFSWFFWLPTALSYCLPLGRIPFFAWFEGGLYALLGFSFWLLLLNDLWPARRLSAMIIKCFAAAAFALNGHSQHLLVEAHPEFAGPAFALIFLFGLFTGNRLMALTAFVLALSLREDMGFHIFGILFLVLVIDLFRQAAPDQRRPILIYACTALGYSVAVLAVKHFVLDDWGLFRTIYAGNGSPFAHISAGLLGERLGNLVFHRLYIWGPGLVAVVWAVYSRNPYIVAGWFAFLPWLILNLIARDANAGNLNLHYGYPFIIAGAWPLLAMSHRFTGARGLPPVTLTSALACIFLLLAVQQPADIFPFRFVYQRLPVFAAEAVSKPAYDELDRRLPRAAAEIGKLRVDWGVYSIAPYTLAPKQYYIKKQKQDRGEAGAEQGVDAVLYFKEAYDRSYVTKLIRVNGLRHHYRLPETRIYLSTAEDIKNIPALSDLFVIANPPPPEAVKAVSAH